jgi:hypothetical protein
VTENVPEIVPGEVIWTVGVIPEGIPLNTNCMLTDKVPASMPVPTKPAGGGGPKVFVCLLLLMVSMNEIEPFAGRVIVPRGGGGGTRVMLTKFGVVTVFER